MGENEPICTKMIHQSFSMVDNSPNNLGAQTVPQLLLLQPHLLSDSMQHDPDWTSCQHITSARKLFFFFFENDSQLILENVK